MGHIWFWIICLIWNRRHNLKKHHTFSLTSHNLTKNVRSTIRMPSLTAIEFHETNAPVLFSASIDPKWQVRPSVRRRRRDCRPTIRKNQPAPSTSRPTIGCERARAEAARQAAQQNPAHPERGPAARSPPNSTRTRLNHYHQTDWHRPAAPVNAGWCWLVLENASCR